MKNSNYVSKFKGSRASSSSSSKPIFSGGGGSEQVRVRVRGRLGLIMPFLSLRPPSPFLRLPALPLHHPCPCPPTFTGWRQPTTTSKEKSIDNLIFCKKIASTRTRQKQSVNILESQTFSRNILVKTFRETLETFHERYFRPKYFIEFCDAVHIMSNICAINISFNNCKIKCLKKGRWIGRRPLRLYMIINSNNNHR